MHGYGYGYVDGVGMMGNGGWFGPALMAFLFVLFVVGVVMLVVTLVRRANEPGQAPMMHGMGHAAPGMMAPPAPQHDEAVAIARKRFAAGDITKEQFDEIMRTLG